MADGTHTLQAIETAVHVADDGQPCRDKRCRHCKPPRSGCGPLRFGAALEVPPAPDYSTPAAIAARIREAGTDTGVPAPSASELAAFRKLYQAARPLLAPVSCEDRHASRWLVVPIDARNPHRGWTLAPRPAPAPAAAPAPAPARRAGRRLAATA